jgi:hypothetical protein
MKNSAEITDDQIGDFLPEYCQQQNQPLWKVSAREAQQSRYPPLVIKTRTDMRMPIVYAGFLREKQRT